MYSPVRVHPHVWHLKQLTCHCLSRAKRDWPCLISSPQPEQSGEERRGEERRGSEEERREESGKERREGRREEREERRREERRGVDGT